MCYFLGAGSESSVCVISGGGGCLELEELKVSGALLGSLKKSFFPLLPDLLFKFL